MGIRYQPGSTSRPSGGTPREPRRFDHLAQYAAPGAYIIDETTGEYSEYDLTPEQAAPRIEWDDLLAQWPLIVADFASEYHLRLHVDMDGMTWQEFRHLLQGVLAADTRLHRHFNVEKEPASE